MLEPAEMEERYSRQIRFAPIGIEGQLRLRDSAVLIVGVGALGSSLAQQMTRAGVGIVRLADRDYVEPSNLQRQSLFDEEDARAAQPKAVAAAAKLRRINGAVRAEPFVTEVNANTVGALLNGVQLVLDGTDNVRTRVALSDACFARGVPLLYGGVTGSEAMSAALVPGETACLRCLIGGDEAAEPEQTCDTAGVIYPAVELAAALQAAEALKWLSGNRSALRRTWLTADVWHFRLREWTLPEGRANCPFCGGGVRKLSGWDKPFAAGGRDEPAAALVGGKRAAVDGDKLRAAGRTENPAVPREAGGAGAAAEERPPRPAQRDADAPGNSHAGEPEATVLCGRDSIQVTTGRALSLEESETRLLARGCVVTARNPYLVRAVSPEGERLVLFEDGRVLVQGTSDPERAVRLCRMYVASQPERKSDNGGEADAELERL